MALSRLTLDLLGCNTIAGPRAGVIPKGDLARGLYFSVALDDERLIGHGLRDGECDATPDDSGLPSEARLMSMTGERALVRDRERDSSLPLGST